MDQPGLAAGEHARALRGLARINWFSRSASIFWPSLVELAAGSTAESPLRVLDVACGGADVTLALARRAARQGAAMQFSGCDISGTALEIARQTADRGGIAMELFQHDVLGAPLPARFDVVICSLFLHHLDEPDVVTLLRSMSQAAAKAVLINDLIRSRWGYVLAWCGTRLLSRSRIVHMDGPLSVAGAFRPNECLALCDQAGMHGVRLTEHWPQRFLISWRKS